MKQLEPKGERLNIAILGKINAGKSSLINALTNQNISIVDSTRGTTTDPVAKRYELVPVGPVTFYDTAGIDDRGELGDKRKKASFQVLMKTDLAILVVAEEGIQEEDKELIKKLQNLEIGTILAFNKADLLKFEQKDKDFCENLNIFWIEVSCNNQISITKLKNKIIEFLPEKHKKKQFLLDDLLKKGDKIVLNCPIDNSAPKHRLILPQVQALRNILDNEAVAIVTQNEQLTVALQDSPKMVITDSQAVAKIKDLIPKHILFTTFSIVFARYKGNLDLLINGIKQIGKLKENDNILIAEACSHHLQDDDIGRYKIPTWLQEYTGKRLNFEFSVGSDYPENLKKYSLIIHCGGCMMSANEVNRRLLIAKEQNVAITNYGILICKINNILERAIEPFGKTITDDRK